MKSGTSLMESLDMRHERGKTRHEAGHGARDRRKGGHEALHLSGNEESHDAACAKTREEVRDVKLKITKRMGILREHMSRRHERYSV